MSFLCRNIFSKLERCVSIASRFSTFAENQVPQAEKIEPIISTTKTIENGKFFHVPRQVWLDTLKTIPDKKLGIVFLHPDIFAAQPRLDIIHENIRWQRMYKFVSFANTKTRAENRGGGKKPWPQKGSGRARHASIRSPLWRKGGRIHGPRSPTTHFYMLPFYKRIMGLTSTLSVKLAQDDLYVVQDLEIPSEEPSYVEELIDKRGWGPSVLFIDDIDFMPRNISIATDKLKHVNLMPVYGLNVYSMLKHETLVLTERAARLVEEKLLFQLNRADTKKVCGKFRINQH
ncbi:39S ribosomal protein L4, mitochondrial [Belonocnema kinseyi]|uniref:39S ribosomal protein L4, mitochondrial n=1 Tax=Belonocnema kinseyi TaxID=2817044 RepID=UPI00143D70E6|nr:39S ribosomal protein L4, mitochondrial [Belonocnema kinseyi]